MNADRRAPQLLTLPSGLAEDTIVAPLSAAHSNSSTPFLPGTTSSAQGEMATPGFIPSTHLFRPTYGVQYPNTMAPGHSGLAPLQPIGTPYSTSPVPLVSLLVRCLPSNTTDDSLRLMTIWSQDIVETELLPREQTVDEGFSTAIFKFKTMASAQNAKDILNGRRLSPGDDTEVIAEIIDASPSGSQQLSNGSNTTSPRTTGSNASPALGGSRQPSRFNGGFAPLDNRANHSNGIASNELPTPDGLHDFHNLFLQQQSQFSNNRTRVSGKSLIENNFADDDETSDLLNNPVAFAAEYNTVPIGRRATEPRIPVTRLQTANINGNSRGNAPTSASVPSPFSNGMTSGHMHPLGAINGANTGMAYPANPHYQQRPGSYPPVNPADQNPPCNTLYVGNLPADTNEEELKALFLKQRGYKRLCFRTKQNGPMCFVEFEDISFATKALHDLYGQPLHNSTKGGIRLSFSKNPLGVRSGHNSASSNTGSTGPMNGHMANGLNGFTTAHGPPPGLSAPPGLNQGRNNFNGANANANTNGNHNFNTTGFTSNSNYPWNNAPYPAHPQTNGTNGGGLRSNNPNQLPPHMIGK